MYAETVLLINHNHPQIGKHYLLLKQGMGANGDLCFAGANGRQLRFASLAFHLARQPGYSNPQWLQPIAEIQMMLFSQNFGGRHYRRLQAVFHRLQCRQHGNDGLAGADITLHQTQHGKRFLQIAGNFSSHSQLCRRE